MYEIDKSQIEEYNHIFGMVDDVYDLLCEQPWIGRAANGSFRKCRSIAPDADSYSRLRSPRDRLA
jgi:hypothetical protein